MSNETITLESAPCSLGCMEDDEYIFSGKDLLHNVCGTYKVVRCRTCGLMRTNPRPTPESIGLYYPENYSPYLETLVSLNKKDQSSRIKQLLKPAVNWIFNSHGMVLPLLKPGRMLEIGCASGSFLHHMDKKGWEVQGVEFSEMAAKEAMKLGFAVHQGALENAPQPKETFDLIVGWMVLEHLHDPVASLKKLKVWAKPGAWMVLSVPNAGSIEFELFKGMGFALQLPTHLYHFKPKTL